MEDQQQLPSFPTTHAAAKKHEFTRDGRHYSSAIGLRVVLQDRISRRRAPATLRWMSKNSLLLQRLPKSQLVRAQEHLQSCSCESKVHIIEQCLYKRTVLLISQGHN